MDYTLIGSDPIPGAISPAGADIRSDDSFVELQSELQKMADPSATSAPDIQKILDNSSKILRTQSKDLTVMCYFIFAQMKLNGVLGLSTGLGCLVDLIKNFWGSLFPDIKRIRGRRNSLLWLNDQITDYLRVDDGSLLPEQDPELVSKLIQQVSELDNVLNTFDENSPSFRNLLQYISALPIKETQIPEANETKAENTEKDFVNSVSSETKTSEKVNSTDIPLATIDDAYRALTLVSNRLLDVSKFLYEKQPVDPIVYRLSRFAIWSSVNQAPPATNGTSLVPPPQDRAKTILDTLLKNNNWNDIISFVESQIKIDCFWLDLNHLAYQALANLGEPYQAAKNEVAIQTKQFIARLPTIVDMHFNDGTPFANNVTKMWLTTLIHTSENSSDSSDPKKQPASQDIQSIVNESRKLTAQGKITEALSLIQDQINKSSKARDVFNARIVMCDILKATNQDITVFADLLIQAIDTHDLIKWDPESAVEGLITAFNIYHVNPRTAEKAVNTLGKLAELDAVKALSITSAQ